MKLYREGKNEIRILLTSEDLKAFSITLEDFDYDSTKGRKIIWELFDRAREETGFDASKEKVYIQLYPKAKGGCELFVTKIEKEDEVEDFFVFSGFDNFFNALSFLDSTFPEAKIYRAKKADLYYILLPSHKVPPHFHEFGEKAEAPSPLYLKSQCTKLNCQFNFAKKI